MSSSQSGRLLRDECVADVRRVIRQHRVDLALLFKERCSFGDRFDGRCAQQCALLGGQRIDIALQQFWYVRRLGTGKPGQLVDVRRVGDPGRRVLAILGVGIQRYFGERFDDFRVFAGEVLAHDPGVERRCANLGQFAGSDQHLAGFLGDTQRRVPDVGRVDVTAFPRGGNGRRREVQNRDPGRVDVPVLECREQAVVAGGNVRHGNLLADQVLGGIDPRAIARNQCLGSTDLSGDQEGLDRQFARGGRSERARAEIPDLYVARSDGSDDVGPVVELAPGDFRVSGFFVGIVGLRHLGWIDSGLVGNRKVGCLCEEGCASQRQRRQQAQGKMQFHDEAPNQAGRDKLEMETK
ncbi:Uncharacterized protein ALO72_04988 [Pseudomonas syringae pv. delphinii]|nr:Uncharacterized protein ALO72_04988 [Pseudomonas syringae pv. delphinii]